MTDSTNGYVGVVPCAGASRRMGRSKALLVLDGRSFLDRVVRSLAEGGCDSVLVVVAEADRAVADQAERSGARVLVNPDPGEGPITSLRLAISRLGASIEGIAYHPVDHPLVRAETVALLIERARASEAVVTLPMHGAERGHPALFRREIFAELADPTLEGGARVVVHRHLSRACLVAVDDPGVLADIDTPEAYAEVTAAASEADGQP